MVPHWIARRGLLAALGLAGLSPAVVRAADAGAAPAGISARAEACLASPVCPAGDAASLLVAASRAHDGELDCFRFLDGAGTPRDLVRGRTCLEDRSGALKCAGSLEMAELVLMRVDGVGGRADLAGARALLDGCFDDATHSALVDHLAAKERAPGTPPVAFCKDIGGTTLTMNECLARESKNAETACELETKAVFAGLDDRGKSLFAAAAAAYRAYVAAMGAFVYEVYVEGTIRNSMALGTEIGLRNRRAKDLAGFRGFVATTTSTTEVHAAQRASAAALAAVGTTTAAEKAALGKTQQAWAAYRDAEIALYEHVFGPTQGVARVRSALLVRLESRRAGESAPPSAEGE